MAVPNNKARLTEALAHFAKSNCKKSIELLKNLDVRTELDSLDDMIQAIKTLAICYFEVNEIQKAKQEIKELYYLDPNYQLDPFDTPKAVIEISAKIKSEIEEESLRMAAIKEVDESIKKAEILKIPSMPPRKPDVFLSLLPFGLNHFSHGATLKGSIYLSLQTSMFAGNIASFWYKQSMLDGFFGNELKNTKNRANFDRTQALQYIFLAGGVLAYGVSLLDALLSLTWQKNDGVKYGSTLDQS